MLSRFEPDEAQRLDELLDAAADAVEAWARDGTSKAANRFNTFQLREADLTRLAPRRRDRRPTGREGHPPDEDGLASRPPGPRPRRPMPESTRPPLRGRRGRDRRIAEKVAADFAARHAPVRDDEAVDFDVAGVDAEVEAARRDETRRAASSKPKSRRADERPRSGHRLPDLSALPPLLAATGSFATLRERLGTPADIGRVGRHASVVAVPHGAKSYLAAALAIDERIVWIARDAEIGDRVAEELQAWIGDPSAVAVLEPRTALAYERSELVADETAARVAALAAWRHGQARVLVASVQALLQHTIDPEDLPDEARELRVGARLHQDTLLRDLLDLGYSPVTEVAGRGEFARRGGIVDVFPPSMELPIRIEFFGDEIDSLRAFDPTDQRTTGRVERAVLLPASEFLLPIGGRLRDPRPSRAAPRPVCPSGSPPTCRGSRARPTTHCGPTLRTPMCRGRLRSATRPRFGPPTSLRRPASTTSTRARSSSSTSRATSPRRPGSCGARRTSAGPSWSRPGSCRRTGRRPTCRRATGRAAWSRRGPSS